MKTALFRIKRFVAGSLVVSGLNLLSANLFAQPTVIYTFSGTSGHYLLEFTLENTTPTSQGFDLYYFGVFANGGASSSPAGYNSSSYTTLHAWDIGNVSNWPYNDTWIDPTYAHLAPGMSLSGFTVLDTDATAPTSVQYFAYGENNGRVYTGPGNQNTGNPTNPFFVGTAVAVIPEPSIFSMAAGALVLLLFRKARWTMN